MRSRFLAWLLIVCLSATGWGEEPSTDPTPEMLGTEFNEIVYDPAMPSGRPPSEVGIFNVLDQKMRADESAPWLTRFGEDYYFQADFIYWQASDPRENGVVIKSGLTVGLGVRIDLFSTGTPNTDHEMGFRSFVGRRLNDVWAMELGGYWLHDYGFPTFLIRQIDPSSGLVAQVYLDPLSDPSADPRIAPGAAERELLASAIIYEIETHGIEWNARALLHNGRRFRVDGIGGLRYLDYDELFGSRLTFLNGAIVDEKFKTENAFFGPQIGTETWYRLFEYLSLRGLLKFGFMSNFHDINVRGPVPGNGVFTSAGNLQGADGTDYATIIEMGLGIVAHLTPNIQLSGGFDAIYISDAYRAMDQLDLANVNARTTTLNPTSESVWLKGFNASLRINY